MRGMKLSGAQLREIRRENARWPDHLVEVPRYDWPSMEGSPVKTGSIICNVWRSRQFLVVEWLEPNRFSRLSVNRTEWDERRRDFRDDISWDDLQRLKREAGYGDQPAVECYPPDAQIVNVGNMRHLFLLPAVPPFFW